MNRSIYIGFDPREVDAFAVACHSVASKLTAPASIHGLVLADLQDRGLYKRPTEVEHIEGRPPRMIDVLSKRADYDGSISTQFAISRFLVPHLAREGIALFMDADMLARGDISPLFAAVEANPSKAVFCVKHDHHPADGIKMDGQRQTSYARKNWSSVLAFNCDHPANKTLTVEMVNTLPGRDLHRFCWIDDSEIGELGAEWNFLIGHSKIDREPIIAHFTEGVPSMAGHYNDPYADEWRAELNKAAMSALGYGS